MNIKKVFIKNFMSIGKDPVKINFEDYKESDIVIIKGENYDIGLSASNGSGKCVDKNTQIIIKYDLEEIINIIGHDPFTVK